MLIFASSNFLSIPSSAATRKSCIQNSKFMHYWLVRLLRFCNWSVISAIPPRVENYQHFHFLKHQKKIARQKIFGCILTSFCDILKIKWGRSPLYMTFYSTKIHNSERVEYSGNFPRKNTRNISIAQETLL